MFETGNGSPNVPEFDEIEMIGKIIEKLAIPGFVELSRL